MGSKYVLKKRGGGAFEKVMVQNFPNLKKMEPLEIQEAPRTRNTKKILSRHNIFKLLKINKEKMIKAVRENKLCTE